MKRDVKVTVWNVCLVDDEGAEVTLTEHQSYVEALSSVAGHARIRGCALRAEDFANWWELLGQDAWLVIRCRRIAPPRRTKVRS